MAKSFDLGQYFLQMPLEPLLHKQWPGYMSTSCADPWRGGGSGGPDPSWNFGKNVVIGFVNGTGLTLHSIYVEYNPDQMCGWCRLELKSVFS